MSAEIQLDNVGQGLAPAENAEHFHIDTINLKRKNLIVAEIKKASTWIRGGGTGADRDGGVG